ncbi:hypothetical protein GP486_006380 [Trichoglossum hirsutum]|uniref:Uncharacterized protein n=1 Tax=Trichoglossum hirsutum TaxID=265104 RepID=A0A9P8L7T8_9PEZI|nr:hypothetical protein GP486_006380 [Trichoglossum hirsutum]
MPGPSRRTSTPPPSAHTTSLPSPPDSSEKTPKDTTRLSSPVIQALEVIRACRRGYPPDNQWIKICFLPGDYEILQQHLREEDLWGYVEDKIRYDWNPQTRELIYRMTTPVHDVFTARVVEEILLWINSIRNCTDIDPRIPALASSIIHRSTSRIFLPGDTVDDTKASPKRSPDAAFIHINANFPGVVIETSFSQKRKDLPKLAEDYILGSIGNIAVVIGLDIEYRKTKQATFSMWRPEWGVEDGVPFLGVKQIADSEDFRTEEGAQANALKSVTLSLSDFLPPSVRTTTDEPTTNPSLSISFTKLFGWLGLSEAHHQVTESRTGEGLKCLPAGVVLRKRAMTLEEMLSPGTERRFRELEEQAEERVMGGMMSPTDMGGR